MRVKKKKKKKHLPGRGVGIGSLEDALGRPVRAIRALPDVWGLGFMVWGLGFGVEEGLGLICFMMYGL